MSDATIRISGLSASSEISVERGESLADVLERAGVDPALDIKVNGAKVDPSDVQVNAGDQVTATPPNVKLG